jgi:hypothetical protein
MFLIPSEHKILSLKNVAEPEPEPRHYGGAGDRLVTLYGSGGYEYDMMST